MIRSGDNYELKYGFATYPSVYLSVNWGMLTEQTYSKGLWRGMNELMDVNCA